MQYCVTLVHSEEGYAVSCPELRGCHSQGATREEAIGNIRIAIREWLNAAKEEETVFDVADVTVEV